MIARALLLGLSCLLLARPAWAQANTARTIGFENGCDGQPVPELAAGSALLASEFYESCGVSAITTGGASAQMQLVAPTTAIAGVTGSAALAGALEVSGAISTEPLVIAFATPANEVSFDVSDLDNESGLRVTVTNAAGAELLSMAPLAQAGVVRFSHASASAESSAAIQRVVLRYTPVNASDRWFLDQLRFNAWDCGDGEREMPAGEACDDGNQVQCDGCDNLCRASVAGCFDGMACVAPETPGGCTFCDMSRPPEPGGDILTSPRPTGTVCEDDQFCTLPGECNGQGACATRPNPCDDELPCTDDACVEASDTCTHTVQANWCQVGEECYPHQQPNPRNPCELCDAQANRMQWARRAEGYQCGDPSCRSGTEMPAATCDAQGQCRPGMAKSCEPAMCMDGQSCNGMCSDDAGCLRSGHCDLSQNMCVADLEAGKNCTRSAQCASDFCADGLCCDKPCGGACESCNLQGSEGSCTPLPAMTVDPEARCGAGQFCGPEGACLSEARQLGSACSRSEECASGRCADGLCCDRACDGTCEACDLAGRKGQCSPYARGMDPEKECGAGAVCSGVDTCSSFQARGNGLCAAAPSWREGRALGLASLLGALAVTFAVRRRRKRRGAAPLAEPHMENLPP